MATEATADTFAGGSLTFGSATGITFCILNGSKNGPSVDVIDTTCTNTAGGSRTGMANAFKNLISYTFDIIYDVDQLIEAQAGVEQTITVTHPLQSGQSTGGTEVFTGFLSDLSAQYPLDDKKTATITIQAVGDVVETAGS